ncbi:hypothetical protein JQ621_28810 [Bradyrhizobium manausense]|uniref:hypothetical protein n=1 Tax=Bradyrhizobium manausense TaxID=989370 RepID=UPI001BAB4C9D|nr:hypothetical protein [Bradyrhizobium manausense]MBR1091478.1 hypothetical protein [Bradyrhizobium manausense]
MSFRLALLSKQRRVLASYACLCAFALLSGSLAPRDATAQTVDKSADNLMVVIRETPGANKQDEALEPMGKLRARLADGKEVELELATFKFLGDMQIRFVFDGPVSMLNAIPQDLARLHLSPEQALRLAVDNLKRVYGAPVATPWTGGLMQVQGKSSDLDSSYFLDREFWRARLREHPEGILVAVPKRGGLVFVPLSDGQAVDTLRRGVTYLYSSSEYLRVSSALYLFKDDHWAVFQPPHKP